METLYITLTFRKGDKHAAAIREAGWMFEDIADALCLDREAVGEIDEGNYLSEIEKIKRKFSR